MFFRNITRITIFLFAFNGYAQSSWVPRNPSPPLNLMEELHVKDSNTIFKIGLAGSEVSINGGKFWAKTNFTYLPNYSFYNSCDFPTLSVGFYTKQDYGKLFKTSDGGVSWTTLNVGIHLIRLSFVNETIGFALQLDSSKIFKTIDGGNTWQFVHRISNFLENPDFEAVSENQLFYVREEQLWKSSNGGLNWQISVPGVRVTNSSSQYSCFYSFQNTVYMTALDTLGKIAKSTNGGQSWQVLSTGLDQIIGGVHFISNLVGWCWTGNKILKTVNGGSTWNLIEIPPVVVDGFKVKFLNTNLGYILTPHNQMFRTQNGGISWTRIGKGVFSDLHSAAIQNNSTAWVVGNKGIVGKSGDKGKSWEFSVLDSTEYFVQVIFPSPKIGFIAGYNKLYQTTNGGHSWQKKSMPFVSSIAPKDMVFFGKDTGYISHFDNKIYKTINGGNSWNLVFDMMQMDLPSKTTFLSKEIGFALGYRFHANPDSNFHRLYKTTNGGQSWSEKISPFRPTSFGAARVSYLKMFNEQNGVVNYYPPNNNIPQIHHTSNGGISWNPVPIFFNYYMDSPFFVNPTLGFGMTHRGSFTVILKTEDGGQNWYDLDTIETIRLSESSNLFYHKNKPVLFLDRANIFTSNVWTDEPIYTATGKVVKKENSDCIQDANEPPLQKRVFVAEPGSYFGSSNTAGKFAINLDQGVYSVQQIPLSPSIAQIEPQFCPPSNGSIPVTINGLIDTIPNVNFINDVRFCPILNISQVHFLMRPCMKSSLRIGIENLGNLVSDTEYVHIKFPPQLHFISASSIYDYNAIDSTYRFKIKPLQPFESISISIVDSVSCNPIQLTGQTLCVKATIPNVPNCLLQSPNWDGANLEVASRCLTSGQTRFNIRNSGNAMPNTAQYQIFIDSALVYQAAFQLGANGTMSVTLPVNAPSGFARLVVPQSANHPLSTFASAEANCATGLSTNGLFPPPDQSPLVDIECVTVTNAYDPNDKLVYPRGWGTAGNVEPETEFNYTIRFQNTGTDTAFKVVLVDTLDQNLDIASLQIGIASHPFEFKVSGKGRPVLSWTFNNILLPDSNTNQEKSNGFVRFSIRPKGGLALGIRLENFGDIYFDFNEPIRTNTTVNTLWRPTYTPGILDTVFVTSAKGLVSKTLNIYPNPSKGSFEMEVLESGNLQVVNLQGEIILTQKARKGTNQFNVSALPKGLYLLKLETEKGVQMQKLVLE